MIDNAPSATTLAVATAPGKVILLGEHAVVYGQPAIALPVQAVEARAVVRTSDRPLTITAHFPAGEGRPPLAIDLADPPPTSPLAAAATAALQHAGRTALSPWAIEITSTIPTGRGLGSSAAVAVALVCAIGQAAGEEWDEATLAALAFVSEKQVHGTPSGIDNTVAAYGRPIRFAQGVARPLAVGAPLTLVIADTGDYGATREIVAAVRERYQTRRAIYDDWFQRIGRLADEAAPAIAEGQVVRLGHLMNSNHLILQALRVSTPALDLLVGAARAAGALGAKLSGSGGGGVVVALSLRDKAAEVAAAMRAAGAVQVIDTTVEPG